MTRYKTVAEDCDVRNQARLKEYRVKREQWLDWYDLNSSEPNSIEAQLFAMIFVDLSYRMIANLRKRERAQEYAASSGLLVQLLDQGYVANQILAIRRLLDPADDVISVRRLLNDIQTNRSLITREIYVCYDGLPYDDSWTNLPHSTDEQMLGLATPGLDKFFGSKSRQERFDLLAGVEPERRKRDDVIRPGIFETLTKWLQASPAAKLVKLSHKFLAHAADRKSRNSLEFAGIKLKDVEQTHRAIVRVERAITKHLLFIADGREVAPSSPMGLGQGLDKLFAPPDAALIMDGEWHTLADERNKWVEGLDEALFR
ncbi:MAG TPA: hypothetical protein VGD60_15705 [Candidatus Acidoferrales bacterium]